MPKGIKGFQKGHSIRLGMKNSEQSNIKRKKSLKGCHTINWFIDKFGEEIGKEKYEERCKNVSINTKKAMTNEVCKDISNKSKELWQKQEYREKQKLNKRGTGSKRTQEQKEKIKIAINNPITKAKQSQSMKKYYSINNYIHKGKTYEQIVGNEKAKIWKKNVGMKSKEMMKNPEIRMKIHGSNRKISNLEKKLVKEFQNLNFYNIKISKKWKDNLEFYKNNLSEEFKKKSFIQQCYLCGNSVDFYFPYFKTIIFIDGDYWHCNPKKYKEDFYHKQIKMTAKQICDKDKDITKVLESQGYKVLRFWGVDLKNNSKKCLNKIEESIRSF